MRIHIEHQPAYAIARAELEKDETILAEGGSMISTSNNVQVATRRMDVASGGSGVLGSVVSAAKQMLAGESFLVNRLSARGEEGEAIVAPKLPGDISTFEMTGETDLVIQSSSFLAGEEDITLDGEWGGARSFFGGEGLFMLRASGKGTVLFNAFGGIEKEKIEGERIVDTGHIVAFESSLDFNVEKFSSGWISSYLSGEGLVCRFQGNGTLFTQSRSPSEFGSLLGPKLPPREN